MSKINKKSSVSTPDARQMPNFPVVLVKTESDVLFDTVSAVLEGRFLCVGGDFENPFATIVDIGHELAVSFASANRNTVYLERPLSFPLLLEAVENGLVSDTNDPYVLLPDLHKIKRGNTVVDLSPTEYRLFSVLNDRIGEYVSAAELSSLVWGRVDTGLCSIYVMYVRRKLDSAFGFGCLISARGKGYMLK